MKYKSVILPAAIEDLKEAANWYNQARSGLGKQLVKRFRERIANLRSNAMVCQIRYSGVHTAIVEQFPYMIHYFVDEQEKTIVVISILHTSRNPKLWGGKSDL